MDPDALALLALGESAASDVDHAHLRVCPECAQELASLRRVVDRARDLDPDEPALEPPPDRVWARIEQQIRSAGAQPPQSTPAPAPTGLAERRQPRWLLAAAACLTVVAVATSLFATREPPQGIVATAVLEPLAGTTRASARLLDTDEGRVLEVDIGALPDTDGYFELWLADTEISSMVSLGPLSDGVHILPPGLDTGALPVVDISREPRDGDPAHSGDSVLRGTFAGES